MRHNPYIKKYLCALVCVFVFCNGFVPRKIAAQNILPQIDSIINSLSIEQKVAQLMIVRVESCTSETKLQELENKIKTYEFGGLCFFKSSAWDIYKAVKRFDSISKIPMFMSIDGEWGLGMRCVDVRDFPMHQTLGAIADTSILAEIGSAIGEQCKNLGINWNFLPVVDVNSNPKNPVINMRSFGQDPNRVSKAALAYYGGMKSKKVLGSAKHFPGHGDTESDSHHTLPEIKHSLEELYKIDMLPFKNMIDGGLDAIMVAHLRIGAVDSLNPSSLSRKWIKNILRDSLKFSGLVVTDGLEMKGVLPQSGKYQEGIVELRALEAGNDVLLLPKNPIAAIKLISKAVKQGKISQTRLNESLKRVLEAKFKYCNAHQIREFSDSTALVAALNPKTSKALSIKAYGSAICLLQNKENLLPLDRTKYKSIASVCIGNHKSSQNLQDYIEDYSSCTQYSIDKRSLHNQIGLYKQLLRRHDLIILSICGTSVYPSNNYGIEASVADFVKELYDLDSKLVCLYFSPPYSLKNVDKLPSDALLCAFQDREEAQRAAVDILFGARAAKGSLPVDVNLKWKTGFGIKTELVGILSTSLPEELGIDSQKLEYIDSVLENSIKENVFPCCQVLFAHKSKIFYNKTFGFHTYDSLEPCQKEDIFDIASLTKVFSTTLAYMSLYDRHKYKLEDRLSKYIPRLKKTPKKNITIRQLLAHESGLKPYLPYGIYRTRPYFSSFQTAEFPFAVADSLFLYKNASGDIKFDIDTLSLGKQEYKYSDLGFYYLNEIFEEIKEQSLDEYVQEFFFEPMGLENIGYRPLGWAEPSRIIPTEFDSTWRNRQIKAFVHDPLIAMHGGIGASAGLFSNAKDLAEVSQMLLQKGFYANKRYLDSSTVDYFTSSSFSSLENRRGGGFDKPALSDTLPSPTAKSASLDSYGHSGFTGTYFWVDPQKELVYVFLSNRVYPSAKDNQLVKRGIRTALQEYVYGILPAEVSAAVENSEPIVVETAASDTLNAEPVSSAAEPTN